MSTNDKVLVTIAAVAVALVLYVIFFLAASVMFQTKDVQRLVSLVYAFIISGCLCNALKEIWS